MAEEDKRFARQLLGKVVVTKSGKKFGEIGNITFETRTGELMQIVLKNPTPYTENLNLEKDNNSSFLVPFSAVIAMGDFVVIAEEEVI